MADIDLIKLSRGPSTNFATLTKDGNTVYFLTDTKRIYLGDKEYTRPVDDALNAASDNALSNKAIATQLAEYLQMGKDSAAALYLPLAGGTLTGTLTMKANIVPNGTRTLGTSSAKWNNVYATTFTGTSFTGTAAKATILANARNFSIKNTAGDGTAVSFNGSGNVELTIPALMTNFESITSAQFNVDNGATLKYDSTNEYLYFDFS